MPGVRAGSLNRRLHLQQVTSITDAEGVTAETWSDLAMVWAHINPFGAREEWIGGQTQERITHQVTIRWRPDISVKMRFLYQETPTGISRIFLIHTMLDSEEAHRQIDCLTEEFVVTQVGAT